MGTLLAAESSHLETYVRLITGVAVALLLYLTAHAYAVMTGAVVSGRARWSTKFAAETFVHEVPMLWGGMAPLAALCVAWAFGVQLATAARVALWIAAGSLVFWELFVGLRLGVKPRGLVLEALIGAVFGAALLAVKSILH